MTVQQDPAAVPRVLPRLDLHTKAFWTGGANAQLLIARCRDCSRWVHPPVADCPNCGGPLEPTPVSGDGVVFTYTVNYQQFHPAVVPPYVIALVELPEQPGLRIAANIAGCDPEAVAIGMAVRVEFEQHEHVFVPVFTPRDVT
ncbi:MULTISPECIES: Zn-ribbon domain-containing OB-fold protein [unclassified Mycobacterium]|uniref:Zn-ribbon domain-containing OB-fold protein n=1 Tax=unclassified Mycobacterium TaxID=2642494 RepID=UPI0029C6A6FA|nr:MULTISPECIES: Zn-ribbon domain-containing OB-fold protein [unclassified Mycobacterium]